MTTECKVSRMLDKPDAGGWDSVVGDDDWEVNQFTGVRLLTDDQLRVGWIDMKARFATELKRGRPGNAPFAGMLAYQKEMQKRGIPKPVKG